jgi:hypothetical protein
MINRLFRKTPTVEEFRQVVFQSLKAKGIQMPKNTTIYEDANDYKYSQIWEDEQQQTIAIVTCKNIKKTNKPIKFKWCGYQSR